MSIFEVCVPDLVPEGAKGCARIEHFEVDKRGSASTSIRAVQHGMLELVEPGRYARLIVDGCLMMSDTYAEKRTNIEFAVKARGNVLVAGLGIGMILFAVANKVDHVTVVEKHQDVVDLVEPSVRKRLGDRLTVVTADIFDWRPAKGTRYDAIYFDIWEAVSVDTLAEMATLHRRFGRFKAPSGWMGSWKREQLLEERRLEARWA